MINVAVVQGRITKELELKTTTTGKTKLSFCIANETGYGEHKNTNFINVSCWEKVAETTAQYCRKGSMVSVRGEIRPTTYESNGEKKTFTEIVAQEVCFLDSKSEKPANPVNVEYEEEALPF